MIAFRIVRTAIPSRRSALCPMCDLLFSRIGVKRFRGLRAVPHSRGKIHLEHAEMLSLTFRLDVLLPSRLPYVSPVTGLTSPNHLRCWGCPWHEYVLLERQMANIEYRNNGR